MARLVKTLGMVWATEDFGEHPEVMNGFADLMVAVLGPKAGVGARSAVGQGSLPRNISVEVGSPRRRAPPSLRACPPCP